VIFLAVGLLGLAQAGPANADQSATIREAEFRLDPSDITVTAGQVVHFTLTNSGTIEHNFTVELPDADIEKKLFDSNLKPG
jgi:uncharacterized cupredoxin-like copper-binding protein